MKKLLLFNIVYFQFLTVTNVQISFIWLNACIFAAWEIICNRPEIFERV